MVVCCVYGCRAGYNSEADEDKVESRSFHSFPPRGTERRQKWIRACFRQDINPGDSWRVCSLHFTEADYVQTRTDSNSSRLRQKEEDHGQKPLRRLLKKTAVPSIIHNAPSYLSNPPPPPRTTECSTSDKRRAGEEARLEAQVKAFINLDMINKMTIEGLKEKLLTETLPEGFYVDIIDGNLIVYCLIMSNQILKVSASMIIDQNMSFVININSNIVRNRDFADLCEKPGHVCRISEILNIIARIKSFITEPESTSASVYIDTCIDLLMKAKDSDNSYDTKLDFIIEQLKLSQRSKFNRHYSPSLIVWAYIIYSYGNASYNQLLDSGTLCLPSISTLRKVTHRLDGNGGLDNTAYLQLRLSKLSDYEKYVVLIIDEIYTAKRIEYSSGIT